jgi:hypothetical protein
VGFWALWEKPTGFGVIVGHGRRFIRQSASRADPDWEGHQLRHLPRRAGTSKLARGVSTGFLALGFGVPGAGASSAPRADGGACSGATLTREYTAQAMTYRLRLDLDGCRWWDGSARKLVVFLFRDGGTGAASRYSMMACESGSDPGGARTTVCEAYATLPHDSTEQDVTYQGEAAWEWKDGSRRASFSTTCTTRDGTAGCTDPTDTWHD